MPNAKTKGTPRPEGPDPIDIHVGGRLRFRRNFLGMSQEQLGNASGLTFQQIQKYERGTNRMGASRLFQMGRLLNVPVAWFFESLPAEVTNLQPAGMGENGQEPLEGAPSQDEFLNRRETAELLRAWYKITDPKQRKKILSVIKSMGEDGG